MRRRRMGPGRSQRDSNIPVVSSPLKSHSIMSGTSRSPFSFSFSFSFRLSSLRQSWPDPPPSFLSVKKLQTRLVIEIRCDLAAFNPMAHNVNPSSSPIYILFPLLPLLHSLHPCYHPLFPPPPLPLPSCSVPQTTLPSLLPSPLHR